MKWDLLLKSAEHHRLLPALNRSFGALGVPQFVRNSARTHAWRAMSLTAELARISHHFDQRKVQFLAHKGPAIAQLLYGDPTMRQFGDLDLLVRPKDVSRARTALIELGYEPQLRLTAIQEKAHLRSGYEHVFGLDSDRHLVELQWQIVPRFYSVGFEIENLFRRSMEIEVDSVAMRILGREDLLLVLCVHAAKHGWSQLGMLRDISTLAQSDLDWEWTLREARRLGILKVLQVSLLAACELFDLNVPEIVRWNNAISGVPETTAQLIWNLESCNERDIESIRYFRDQIGLRERWRDRARILWRLTTTPSVAEWRMVRLPDRLQGLYRAVRIARLMKRLLNAAAGIRKSFSRKSHQPARARGNSNGPAAPTPRGENPAAAPLLSSTEILPGCKNVRSADGRARAANIGRR